MWEHGPPAGRKILPQDERKPQMSEIREESRSFPPSESCKVTEQLRQTSYPMRFAMKRSIRRWSPSILMMTLIFMASGTPGTDLPQFGVWDMVVKKGGHMMGYALLAIAFLYGLTEWKPPSRRQTLFALLLAALYAATDEFHQGFTPARNPAVIDVAIDTLGGLLGLLVWARLSKSISSVVHSGDGALPQ